MKVPKTAFNEMKVGPTDKKRYVRSRDQWLTKCSREIRRNDLNYVCRRLECNTPRVGTLLIEAEESDRKVGNGIFFFVDVLQPQTPRPRTGV